MVLSIARQRRGGRSQEVFLDAMLQANLTERQVTFDPDWKYNSIKKTSHHGFCDQNYHDYHYYHGFDEMCSKC